MLHAVTKQHEAVVVDFALGEFQSVLADCAGKERNAGAEQDGVHFENQFVNFGEESLGNSPPPQSQMSLPVCFFNSLTVAMASSETSVTFSSGLSFIVREKRCCFICG